MSDDDRKLSWREIDQRRDGTYRGEPRKPRGKRAEERSEQATRQYLKEIDKLFSGESVDEAGGVLAKAVRDAHGTAELDGACLALRDEVGMPGDAGLLSIFLDCKDAALVIAALELLLEMQKRGDAPLSKGIQSQLRVLAQGFDNDVADIAEEILEEL